MSITGDAGRPALPSRRRDLRHRHGHVRGPGHSAWRSSRARGPVAGSTSTSAMLDSMTALLTYQASIYFATGAPPPRHRQPAPDDRALRHVHGERTAISCSRSATTSSGGRSAASPGSTRLPATRDSRATAIVCRTTERSSRILADRLKTRTRAEWLAALTAEGVPCGSVRDVGEVLEDPHLHARDMVQPVDHPALGEVRVLGVPMKLSDTPGSVRTAPPMLGQHTDRILRGDLGLSEEQSTDCGRIASSDLSEGLRPSDSPTRALARHCAGALRARGSLAMLARTLGTSVRFMQWLLPRKQRDQLGSDEFQDVSLAQVDDGDAVAHRPLCRHGAAAAAAVGSAQNARGSCEVSSASSMKSSAAPSAESLTESAGVET